MRSLKKLMFAVFATLVAVCSLGGCAALIPNTVGPEVEHLSHFSQHAPLTEHPTNYGANMLNVIASWDLGTHGYVSIGEGIDLDRHYSNPDSCGEIEGPREEFSARLGYRFQIK